MNDESSKAKPPSAARPPLNWSDAAPFPFTRESTIRLDAAGHFWHEGDRVEHPGLERAMHGWISRHPDNGRYVLENGWDWCYLKVDDAPFLVRAVAFDGPTLVVRLSDGTTERVAANRLYADDAGVLVCDVKPNARGGAFVARFDSHAMSTIAERLAEERGAIVLRTDAGDVAIQPK